MKESLTQTLPTYTLVRFNYGCFESQNSYHAHIKRKPDTWFDKEYVLIHTFT